MSEKRLASSGDSFVDLTEMQTVDLLNKLSDENTRLHKKVDEQQATIENYQKSRDKWRTKCHQAEEKVEYWKHKSLDLYKLLRRVNLSDKEWEEFLNIINENELEDDGDGV